MAQTIELIMVIYSILYHILYSRELNFSLFYFDQPLKLSSEPALYTVLYCSKSDDIFLGKNF